MHQTPPDTTRHAPDTTRHYQTCTRQCLIGWQWSCDDLKSYTAGPDFSCPEANGRTKMFQEVLADLKSENPLITIHWIWYRKSSLIFKVYPVHSINHGVVLNFQSVLQSFAFLPIWARNWLEQCANLHPATRSQHQIQFCSFKGSHKKKLGKSGQADRLGEGGSPPSRLTASICESFDPFFFLYKMAK